MEGRREGWDRIRISGWMSNLFKIRIGRKKKRVDGRMLRWYNGRMEGLVEG